jgi:UDP-N-acetylglucosamine 2-epimerase
MKILTVLGARPHFIKAATVSREIKASDDIEEVIVHTGQHFDAKMSDVFFDQLDIPRPQHNLHIAGLSHGAMTGRMLEGIESLILQEQPDWALVYGDTNSTLAGALAAAKLPIPVAHFEAGLRDETEWVETVEAGWNELVGASAKKILSVWRNANPPSEQTENLYGNENAVAQAMAVLN